MDHYSIENVGPGTWENGSTFFRHPVLDESGECVGLVVATLDANRPDDDDRRQWIADRLNMMVADSGAEVVRRAIEESRLQV